jgi:ribosomal protein S18 acetylase RimI-like enzyme
LSSFTSRFLERKDLLSFLSGQLLGFALDEYFDGAYLGAFDADGAAGFIFTGHPRSDGEILIGVPHAVKDRETSRELESFLIEAAVGHAKERGPLVVAAVYSDQAQGEIVRLQEIYRSLGFRYTRDSTILARMLEGIEISAPEPVTESIDAVVEELLLSVAADCSRGTGWSDVDFGSYIPAWRKGITFDPELFRISFLDGEPSGIFMARLDSLDRKEGAFYFLGVLPEYRSMGVGKAILTKGLSMMKERGATRTRQTVPSGEGHSLRLLESAGYRVTEWARFFALDGGGQSQAPGMRMP